MACVCGHSEEEHGNDSKFPGSSACMAGADYPGDGEPCDCVAYEEDGDGDDDEMADT